LKLAGFLRNLPRTKLGVLIGLLTGHVRLNKQNVNENEEMSAGSFVQFAEKSGRFETRA
jgi:hypothetical protein